MLVVCNVHNKAAGIEKICFYSQMCHDYTKLDHKGGVTQKIALITITNVSSEIKTSRF